MSDALLQVSEITKEFGSGPSRFRRSAPPPLRAVDQVSFEVRRGETFGIVGESGCGKSTLTRAILRLLEPTSGSVVFDGIDVGGLGTEELRQLRKRMQLVFQDPFGSLDPRMSALAIVAEALEIHGVGDSAERETTASEMLELVGIPAAQHQRRPFAFSGGQRQRIGVARALVLRPDLVFLDEPISALDVSIQAQVLNLLKQLQADLGLTYVFIVHDLAVAEYFCDRVAVLYRGAIMEIGDSRQLFSSPLHPYTASLLSAVPIPDPEVVGRRERIVLRGDVGPMAALDGGCRFRARCPVGRDREICAAQAPPLTDHAAGHAAACHFPGELAKDAAA
jgi:oligopeptide/dipeptide ABC transporter ATP-binding protein